MVGGLRCVVIRVKCDPNRSRGYGAVGGRKWPFPITLASRLYNSLYYRTSRYNNVTITSKAPYHSNRFKGAVHNRSYSACSNMRIRNGELNVRSEEKCLQRRLETVQGRRTETCERITATGFMPPDLRRMHVRRTLSSSAELQGRRQQTTEFDLQQRNLRKARINMQGPVRASLCTSWLCCLVRLAVQNFTSVGAEGGNAGAKPLTDF